MNITKFESNNTTMTSLELLKMINDVRKEFDEPEVRNNDFLKRIEDELEGELSIRKTFINPSGGRPKDYYDLTIEQCTLVGFNYVNSYHESILDDVISSMLTG